MVKVIFLNINRSNKYPQINLPNIPEIALNKIKLATK